MTTIDLSQYHCLLLNTSGGKDSQTMIAVVYSQARALGIENRLIAVHADLGRVEWEGTKELAQRQAAHYGIPFYAIKRNQGDLLQHIEARGKWPSSTARYCTSDHKRAQVSRVVTAVGQKLLQHSSHIRILNCLGFRAEESPARAKREPFSHNERLTTQRRWVDDWLPIHDWTEQEVWSHIHTSGVEYHKAYTLGMPRLSCCFCIFSPKSALMVAARHNPELFAEYLALEKKIGHTFRHKFSLQEVKDALERGEEVKAIESWHM